MSDVTFPRHGQGIHYCYLFKDIKGFLHQNKKTNAKIDGFSLMNLISR
jgi:hypothetical protein